MIKGKRLWSSLVLGALLSFSSLQAKEDFNTSFANDEIFQEFQKVQEEMVKIFEKFDKKFFSAGEKSRFFDDFSLTSPRADLKDKKDHYEIKVDMPGSKDADIKVKVEGKLLKIDAKIVKEEKKEGENYLKQERVLNSFHRALSLPADADGEALTTAYKDGVLTINIPKQK
jgi:HSP20 family protein